MPYIRELFIRPFYPINTFWRIMPALGMWGVVGIYYSLFGVDQYKRLHQRLEEHAFTYVHPIRQAQLQAEKDKELQDSMENESDENEE